MGLTGSLLKTEDQNQGVGQAELLLEVLGKNSLPSLFRLLAGPVPCGCRTEVPVLLLDETESQFLESALKSFPCSPPSSKPLTVHQILLLLRVSDSPFAIRQTQFFFFGHTLRHEELP